MTKKKGVWKTIMHPDEKYKEADWFKYLTARLEDRERYILHLEESYREFGKKIRKASALNIFVLIVLLIYIILGL